MQTIGHGSDDDRLTVPRFGFIQYLYRTAQEYIYKFTYEFMYYVKIDIDDDGEDENEGVYCNNECAIKELVC